MHKLRTRHRGRILTAVTEWLTTRQAAEHIQRSTRFVLNAARSGELAGYQTTAPHGSWRFKLSDVDGWQERG
ncbi:hypothetical protein CH254_02275 [Rhodococcus sp. 06-412-2C]|nr:hypothetical protein CH254_02275 [Rhodococcus sp. 06-412-2C]OZC95273.1 hypothetical protein CH279_18705 [Rhodococcus sp. 06-412-2B]